MNGGVFLVQNDGSLARMTPHPYDAEAKLQQLLEEYPSLLSGDQPQPDTGSEWLLVSREFGIADSADGADRWSLDHLFLDREGVPTLVEVKLGRDPRARREVVGQMFDYAANGLLYWTMEKMRDQFTGVTADDTGRQQELLDFLGGPDADADAFWAKVRSNLGARKIRLLFVADEIPRDLQTIIEFLNGQMTATEVLGVEVRQFKGQDQAVYVSRIVGRTATAQQEKSLASPKRQWNEETFLSELAQVRGGREADVARKLFEWAHQREAVLDPGYGSTYGMLRPIIGDRGYTVKLYTNGDITVPFSDLRSRPPFDDAALCTELRDKLNTLPGPPLPAEPLKYPNLKMKNLVDERALNKFLEILDWMVDLHRKEGR